MCVFGRFWQINRLFWIWWLTQCDSAALIWTIKVLNWYKCLFRSHRHKQAVTLHTVNNCTVICLFIYYEHMFRGILHILKTSAEIIESNLSKIIFRNLQMMLESHNAVRLALHWTREWCVLCIICKYNGRIKQNAEPLVLEEYFFEYNTIKNKTAVSYHHKINSL